MKTLLFKESPLLFTCVSILFGIADRWLHRYRRILMITYIIIAFMLAYFYRLPHRKNNYPSKMIVAPCDGKIISINKINHVTTHIAIFISLFDSHVQWSPVSGIVESITHKTGSFHPAYILNKSRYNERTEMIMYVPQIKDEIKIVQIAGQMARRIVTYVNEQDHVKRGDIFGMIKLGSRVDLFVPHDKIKLLVNVGDVVLGNKTIFGSLRNLSY